MDELNKNGKVIILNGTSSSGKTSLAQASQLISSEPFLRCSLDAFWEMTPPHIPASSSTFPQLKLAMAKSVRALAETGHKIIVDTIFSGVQTYTELSKELNEIEFAMVKVECSLDELEKREKTRGDRKLGLAKSQLKSVHEGLIYDLVINTNELTPEEGAKSIATMLNNMN